MLSAGSPSASAFASAILAAGTNNSCTGFDAEDGIMPSSSRACTTSIIQSLIDISAVLIVTSGFSGAS